MDAAKPFYRVLGKRVSELRKAQQLTQKELAARIGVTQQAMFSYEIADRRVPTSARSWPRAFFRSRETMLPFTGKRYTLERR